MSCKFCGNEKVDSYATCECWMAIKFVKSMKKGEHKPPEQGMTECDECNLILVQQDIIRAFKGAGRKYKQEYKCPRCGHTKVVDRIIIKEKYR